MYYSEKFKRESTLLEQEEFERVVGDQVKTGKNQLDDLGDVGELVEKDTSKNGKRLVDDIYNYTNMKTILGIHSCSRVLLVFNNEFTMSS
ncbi:hypothetical protein ACI3LX_003444 [Candidozyma auris]